jgi:hypothetical protein
MLNKERKKERKKEINEEKEERKIPARHRKNTLPLLQWIRIG